MMAPHERPLPGSAANFAATLQATLPTFETERLSLRAPRLEDFPHYAEIVERDGGRFLVDEPGREAAWYDFVQMTATWLLRGHGIWTLELRDGEEVAGFALLGFEPGDHEPELGYMLRRRFEGRGIAAEAARAVQAYAFDRLGFETLVSTIDHDNGRSVRLAERLGGRRDAAAEAAHGGDILVYRYSAAETGS